MLVWQEGEGVRAAECGGAAGFAGREMRREPVRLGVHGLALL